MSRYLLNFPWNDYCFWTCNPDLAAAAVSEVMDLGMREFIPSSLIIFSPSNPWSDYVCSSAISDRKGAHRLYQDSPSELTHVTKSRSAVNGNCVILRLLLCLYSHMFNVV